MATREPGRKCSNAQQAREGKESAYFDCKSTDLGKNACSSPGLLNSPDFPKNDHSTLSAWPKFTNSAIISPQLFSAQYIPNIAHCEPERHLGLLPVVPPGAALFPDELRVSSACQFLSLATQPPAAKMVAASNCFEILLTERWDRRPGPLFESHSPPPRFHSQNATRNGNILIAQYSS